MFRSVLQTHAKSPLPLPLHYALKWIKRRLIIDASIKACSSWLLARF